MEKQKITYKNELKAPIPPKLDELIFEQGSAKLSHPGAILRERYMKPARIDSNALADRIGVSRKEMAFVVTENRPMTVGLSVRLGRYFGVSSTFFMRIQIERDAFLFVGKHNEELNYIKPFE